MDAVHGWLHKVPPTAVRWLRRSRNATRRTTTWQVSGSASARWRQASAAAGVDGADSVDAPTAGFHGGRSAAAAWAQQGGGKQLDHAEHRSHMSYAPLRRAYRAHPTIREMGRIASYRAELRVSASKFDVPAPSGSSTRLDHELLGAVRGTATTRRRRSSARPSRLR